MLDTGLRIIAGACLVALAGFILWVTLTYAAGLLSGIGLLFFKPRRWVRIIKDAGHQYDWDGLRFYHHPDHGRYYRRGFDVIKPLSSGGWYSSDGVWAVGYSGYHDRLYWTRRTRHTSRIPKHLRTANDSLESWREVMIEIDRHANPGLRSSHARSSSSSAVV